MKDRDPDLIPAQIEYSEGAPFSPAFDDVYYSRAGGWDETRHVFLTGNRLPDRWCSDLDPTEENVPARPFVIAETGFGTGLNFLVAASEFLNTAPSGQRLHYLSVEKHPLRRQDLVQALEPWHARTPLVDELAELYPSWSPGFHRLQLAQDRLQLTLLWGEASTQLSRVPSPAEGLVDAWFLDGFSPAKNESLWSEDVIHEIGRLTRAGGTVSTFTSAGFVRRGLSAEGFQTRKIKGFGRKREMTVATLVEKKADRNSKPWLDVWTAPKPAGSPVAIIGAGLAGTSVAAALARRGHSAIVFDQASQVAGDASGNPTGSFHCDLLLENNFRERFYTTAHGFLTRQLRSWDPAQTYWRADGMLHLILDSERDRFSSMREARSVDPELAQWLSADEASGASGIELGRPALFYPTGGWLEPRRLCRHALERDAQRISVQFDTRVESLKPTGPGWRLLDRSGASLGDFDHVVVANALDAKRWIPDLPLRPVRGQVTQVPASSTSEQLRTVIHYGGYVIPAVNGSHMVGATFQPGESDPSSRTDDDEANVRSLLSILPQFATAATHSGPPPIGRASLRAVTPDHLPLVGPVPDSTAFDQAYRGLTTGRVDSNAPPHPSLPGLYVSVGHGSRGVVTCPLAAELLCDLIDATPLPVESMILEHLLPSRYWVRRLKRSPA